MIDLHCHILPGVDDGPSSMDECVEMARIAYEDGIRTIVATPHIKDGIPSPTTIKALASQLNAAVKERGIEINILTGAEMLAHDAVASAPSYTISQSRYVLMEFQHNFVSINASSMLFDLITRGFIPVFSHAERIPSVIDDPNNLLKFIDMGCLIQITSASLIGEFGQDIKTCATHLLKSGKVHVMATDAHSSTWRLPLISKALRKCENLIGAAAAASLVFKTPHKIISDIFEGAQA